MDKKWHYTEKGEYPVIFGEYENKNYPQIPCLVQEKNGNYGIRYWNCTEECWDDEVYECFGPALGLHVSDITVSSAMR